MAALLTIVCFPFLVLETLIGMVANGSIVLINLVDWFRRRKLSQIDSILTCLGLSRLLLQAVLVLQVTLYILHNDRLSTVVFVVLGVWVFINSVNLWFAACLSVFYLAKIANFSHAVFLHFKRRFFGLLPWLLLGSVVFSAVQTIIVTRSWKYFFATCNPYRSLSRNRSNAEMHIPQVCWYTFALLATFDFIPFMVFLSSSILLITSLWKHVRHLQHNGTGITDLNTQSHLSAIKALASFAVLYLISFPAVTLQSVLVWNNKFSWTTVLLNTSALCPSGHAIILIIINPKLKQAWSRMLQHFKSGSRCKISRNVYVLQILNAGK